MDRPDHRQPYVDLDGTIGYARPSGDGCPECLRKLHDSADPADAPGSGPPVRHEGTFEHCRLCRPFLIGFLS